MRYLYTAWIVCFLLAFIALGLGHAQVYSPWVLLKGQPDTRDLESLTRTLYEQADARTDRQRAEAIWRYLLTDGRFVKPGIFYHIAGWAYEEPLGEVLDPLKLLNSYGFGLCYQVAPLLESLYESGGFRDARVWFLTGHTVTEVFFDGKYNMLDSDMLGYTTLGEGDPRKSAIASVCELAEDESIILDKMLAPDKADSTKVVYPWYPADVRAKAMKGYAELFSTRKDNWLFPYPRSPRGHSMDFVLRPGERLIRYFKPECQGLYYLPYKKVNGRWQEFPREIKRYNIRTEDGPKSQKDSRLWSTGRFEYKPLLWQKEAYYPVFASGFNQNLRLPEGPNEPLTRMDGNLPASAVFEMASPYVIIDGQVSLYAELASAAHRLTVETSVDRGRTWQLSGTLTGPYSGPWKVSSQVVSITEHGTLTALSGRYGYLVRLSLSGPQPAKAASIRELELTSLIQLNPRTLPELKPGRNELVYKPGPQRKRWCFPVDLERLDEFAYRVKSLECVVEEDNLLLKPKRWRQGEVIFELSSPDGSDLVQFEAGGRFLVLEKLAPQKLTAEVRETAQRGASPTKARAWISWATSPEGPFAKLWEYDPKLKWLDGKPVKQLLRWPEVDRKVEDLPPRTKKVYLRYHLAGMALDDVRLSFSTPAKKTSTLELTHQWLSNGSQRSYTIEITEPELEYNYEIDTGRRGVENLAVILACPGRE